MASALQTGKANPGRAQTLLRELLLLSEDICAHERVLDQLKREFELKESGAASLPPKMECRALSRSDREGRARRSGSHKSRCRCSFCTEAPEASSYGKKELHAAQKVIAAAQSANFRLRSTN